MGFNSGFKGLIIVPVMLRRPRSHASLYSHLQESKFKNFLTFIKSVISDVYVFNRKTPENHFHRGLQDASFIIKHDYRFHATPDMRHANYSV